MMAPPLFQIGLFQLSAEAWLSPQAVAQAVQTTEVAELLPWAETVPPLMADVGMEPSRISRSQRAVKEMATGIQEGDRQRAERNKKRFANLIAGVKPQQKWERVVEKSGWAQSIQKIFRPEEIVSPSTNVPVPGSARHFHEHILNQLRQSHKPGQRITTDAMKEDVVPNRALVGDVAELVAANIEDVTGGVFAALTPKERVVVHLKFGIPLRKTGTVQKKLTEYEIAKLLGLSKEEIVQLERDTAKKLRRYGSDLWHLAREIKSNLSQLERASARQLSGEMADWGGSSLKRGISGFRELSSYLCLKGIPLDRFDKLQNSWIKFPRSPCHYVVIFAEQGIFMPDEIFERAMDDWKGLIREFVLNEAVAVALIAAIENRKSGPEEVARFLAQIDIREWDLELAEYIYRGCPLDVELYSGYREDCSSRSCDDVLKYYDLFVEELSNSGVITYYLKSSFCYQLTDYYIREMEIFRERFGLPDLDVWETVFSSVDRFGGDIQKIDLKGILMPGRRDQRRGKDEMDIAVMGNMGVARAIVENRLPQLVNGFFDVKKFEGVKTADEFDDREVQLRVEFYDRAHHEFQDGIRPVKELKKAGFPLSGELFTRYTATPNRLQKMEETKQRARELASGSPLGSMDDPFEVMAVLRLLGSRAPLLSTVLTILEQAEIPDRSPDVYFAPFIIASVPLTKPFYTVANRGLLAEYAQEIHNVSTLNGLVKTMKNFSGNKKARQAIQKYLDELELIPDENTLSEEQYKAEVNKTFTILIEISNAIKQWLTGRTKYLVRDRSKAVRKKAMEQAVKEIDVYLKNILVATQRWGDERYRDSDQVIWVFDKKEATQEETYRVLDQLSEFYHYTRKDWKNTFRNYPEQPWYKRSYSWAFPFPTSLDEILNELDKMNNNKKTLKKTGETKDITLTPVTGKLAALYGYLSENSLARSDWAVHAMRDPGFVPYFMCVDGECQGVVQTFTKVVIMDDVKKKILIVTGVDPQLRLTPDPSAFIKGLEDGFSNITAAGGYDLVVVPALDFAQSSRRALLRHEFNRYTEKNRLDEPIGFPQVGIREDGRPIYYHDEVHGEARHQEFLVFHHSKP